MSIIKQDYGSFQDMATQHMLAPILQNLVNDTGAVMPVDSYFIFNNELYKVTTDIASGATIVVGTTSGCNANYAKTITEEMTDKCGINDINITPAQGISFASGVYAKAIGKVGFIRLIFSSDATFSSAFGLIATIDSKYGTDATFYCRPINFNLDAGNYIYIQDSRIFMRNAGTIPSGSVITLEYPIAQ